MPKKLDQNDDKVVKQAVPEVYEYREKFRAKTLTPGDLPRINPRVDKVPESAEERNLLNLGDGVQQEWL